jgi:hypothetical protein
MNQEGGKTAGDYLTKLANTASAFQPDKQKLYCASDVPLFETLIDLYQLNSGSHDRCTVNAPCWQRCMGSP